MIEERISERTDAAGNVTERVVERDTMTPVAVETRGGMSGVMVIVVLLVLAVGAYFLFNLSKSEARKDDAVAAAAKDVGETARKAGDAVEEVADDITK